MQGRKHISFLSYIVMLFNFFFSFCLYMNSYQHLKARPEERDANFRRCVQNYERI